MRNPSPQYRYEHYDPGTMPRYTIPRVAHCDSGALPMTWATCNRTEWACGCVTWLDLLPNGAWLTRTSPCDRHRAQEGSP